MGMKWQVPDLCHVNGATWFSGGAVSHTHTISTNVHFRIFQSTLCVLYMAHFAYCTKHILHSVHTLQCTDCLSQVCHMPYAECALYHVPLCHVPCAIVLCAMYRMCFIQVSHAGQWPICQQERAIDRIFAPRSFSK